MERAVFEELWREALREGQPNSDGAVGQLVKSLAEVLDVEQIQYSQLPGTLFFLFDLGMLGFKKLDLNVFMVAPPPENPQAIEELRRLSESYVSMTAAADLCFFLVLSPDPISERLIPNDGENIVYLSGGDLRRLLTEQRPYAVLFEILERWHTLVPSCPYNRHGIARGAMFHGRKTDLNAIVYKDRKSFAVSGARRIGKSSLMKKAEQHMLRDKGNEGHVFYFICLNWKSSIEALSQIAHKIDPKALKRIDKGSGYNFVEMLAQASRHGKDKLHFFFDEVDALIDIDSASNWLFFSNLLVAVEEDYIRVVFGGYRMITRLMDLDAPFYDKLERLHLGRLLPGDAQALITKPFISTGFTIQYRQAYADKIWDATGGFPFLIQYFGEYLFDNVVERGDKTLTPDDVAEIADSLDFERFAWEHFEMNTMNGDAPVALERLSVALLADEEFGVVWNIERFLSHIFRVAHHRFPNTPGLRDELYEALQNLVEAGILIQQRDGFALSLPVFQRAISRQFPEPRQIID